MIQFGGAPTCHPLPLHEQSSLHELAQTPLSGCSVFSSYPECSHLPPSRSPKPVPVSPQSSPEGIVLENLSRTFQRGNTQWPAWRGRVCACSPEEFLSSELSLEAWEKATPRSRLPLLGRKRERKPGGPCQGLLKHLHPGSCSGFPT